MRCTHTEVFQGFQSLDFSLLSLTHKVKVQALSVLCSYIWSSNWVLNATLLLCITSNLQGLVLSACKPHYCGLFKASPFFICPHISLICHSRIPLSIVYFASEIYALCSALYIMHSKASHQQMLMYWWKEYQSHLICYLLHFLLFIQAFWFSRFGQCQLL